MPKTLSIPAGIPRPRRLRTNAGFGSFFTTLEVAIEPQEFRLQSHVLIISPSDYFQVEVDGQWVVLEPGGAFMAGFQTIRVEGPGELHLFVFGHRVVQNVLGLHRVIEAALFDARPDDPALKAVRAFYPGVAYQVSAGPHQYVDKLTEVITVLMLEKVPASVYAYFRRTFYGPRWKMYLELEKRLFSREPVSFEFERQFRELNGVSSDEWLGARRAELTMQWLMHGPHPAEKIAEAFSCDLAALEEEIGEHCGTPLRQVKRDQDWTSFGSAKLAETIRPSWMPPPSELIQPSHDDSLFPDDHFEPALFAEMQKRKQFILELKPQGTDEFWAMKTTGVGTLFRLPAFLRPLASPVAPMAA